MKILGIDISHLFSMKWEAEGGEVNGEAKRRAIEAITAARQGYDRWFLACDAGPSYRKQIAEYKANREPRGEVYRDQLRSLIDRCRADGAAILTAPQVGTFPATGAPSFAEADDVLGWAADMFSAHVDTLSEEARAEWKLAILTDDSDIEQVIDNEHNIVIVKSALRGGEEWNEARVLEKRGVTPDKIADVKALAGDDTDNYLGFCNDHIEGATPPKRGPGIGPKTAVGLIRKYGGALAIFDHDAAKWEADGMQPLSRMLLAKHGKAQAERGLFLARLADLSGTGLDFAAVLAEPVVSKIAEPVKRFAPAVEGEPVALKPIAAPAQGSAALVIRSDFDPLALQPKDLNQLEGIAATAFNSRGYTQFRNVDQVVMCLMEARERGIPVGAALRSAYIVRDKLAWSASFLAGLVLSSGKAEFFEIVETTSQKATLIYKRKGRPEGSFTFTIEEAQRAGWIKNDSKWATNPRTMLRWAAIREAARAFFPDVVSGMYTPDELRDGHVLDAEFDEAA